MSEDALAALRKWRECGGNSYAAPPAALHPDLVVDGLFGIGLTRALEGRYAELIAGINRMPGRKLALDIASGINADTGAVMGTAVRATHTITFIALKPGLLTLDGPDYCGEIRVADLGLDAAHPAGGERGHHRSGIAAPGAARRGRAIFTRAWPAAWACSVAPTA